MPTKTLEPHRSVGSLFLMTGSGMKDYLISNGAAEYISNKAARKNPGI
jgi:hypothetical protein